MPKKILILTFHYSPDLRPCAFRTESLVDALCNKLDNAGDPTEIDVITTQPTRYAAETPTPEFYTKQGRVNIYRVPLANNKDGFINEAILFLGFAYKALKIINKQQYSLVFATTARLMTGLLATIVAMKQKAKLYIDIRDNFVSNIKELFNKPLALVFGFLFSMVERLIVRRANKINLNSEGFRQHFSSRYPKKNFSFFTNGLDTGFWSVEPNSQRHPQGEVKVLYAGNLGKAQALHEILPQMAKKLNGRADFTVIGAGRSSSLLELEVARLGLSNLKVLPPISRAKLAEYYRQDYVLFLHLDSKKSFKQVLPSKLFEYAASGRPILAGVDGYAKEFIQTEITNAIVFPPCNVDAAVKAFNEIDYNYTPRCDFADKFSRSFISQAMVDDILKC